MILALRPLPLVMATCMKTTIALLRTPLSRVMGHGFLHGSLRIIKQSHHPQPSPRLEIPDQDCESSIIFQAVDLTLGMEIGGKRRKEGLLSKKEKEVFGVTILSNFC